MYIYTYIYTYIYACMPSFSVVSDFFRLHGLFCQPPLTMGFSKQECWSGLPFPTPEMFLTQRSNPHLLHLPALAGEFYTTKPTGRPPDIVTLKQLDN